MSPLEQDVSHAQRNLVFQFSEVPLKFLPRLHDDFGGSGIRRCQHDVMGNGNEKRRHASHEVERGNALLDAAIVREISESQPGKVRIFVTIIYVFFTVP